MGKKLMMLLGALGLIIGLHGCASSANVLEGFDTSNFRKRNIVVLKNQGVVATTVLASNYYESFARDGISDQEFTKQICDNFMKTLADGNYEAKIKFDTVSRWQAPDDSCTFEQNNKKIMVLFPRTGMDTNDLYLFFTPIRFSRDYNLTPGFGSIPSSSQSHLKADMEWVVYDPKSMKAVAGGNLSAMSSTFVFVTTIVTQSDWFADARKLAAHLDEAIAELR